MNDDINITQTGHGGCDRQIPDEYKLTRKSAQGIAGPAPRFGHEILQVHEELSAFQCLSSANWRRFQRQIIMIRTCGRCQNRRIKVRLESLWVIGYRRVDLSISVMLSFQLAPIVQRRNQSARSTMTSSKKTYLGGDTRRLSEETWRKLILLLQLYQKLVRSSG